MTVGNSITKTVFKWFFKGIIEYSRRLYAKKIYSEKIMCEIKVCLSEFKVGYCLCTVTQLWLMLVVFLISWELSIIISWLFHSDRSEWFYKGCLLSPFCLVCLRLAVAPGADDSDRVSFDEQRGRSRHVWREPEQPDQQRPEPQPKPRATAPRAQPSASHSEKGLCPNILLESTRCAFGQEV